jgi:hypothetical protein
MGNQMQVSNSKWWAKVQVNKMQLRKVGAGPAAKKASHAHGVASMQRPRKTMLQLERISTSSMVSGAHSAALLRKATSAAAAAF